MSDFLYDMGDDQTTADDRLDQLLTSVDAELLAAIGTAQASTEPTWRTHLQLPIGGRFEDVGVNVRVTRLVEERLTAHEEVNEAVLLAEFVLQEFMDALNSGGHLRHHSRLANVFMAADRVKQRLRTRELTSEMAEDFFSSARSVLRVMKREGKLDEEEVESLRQPLVLAQRAVLYLFDRSDDYEGCPVPLR